MRGLRKLIWVEIKIFVREPLGVIASVGIPLVIFVMLARAVGPAAARGGAEAAGVEPSFLAVLPAMVIAIGAVVSLVAIVSIYREGGILKRLRATPLQPLTILTAHVAVKLLFTFVTIVLMALAGRQYLPPGIDVPVWRFAAALTLTTFSILSLGFVIASAVPTARFAQPLASLILYPMLAVSGLFFPVDQLPPAAAAVAHVLPLTYAVSFLTAVWNGAAWSTQAGNLTALAVSFGICAAVASRIFRWE